jgi:hypothetical protein
VDCNVDIDDPYYADRMSMEYGIKVSLLLCDYDTTEHFSVGGPRVMTSRCFPMSALKQEKNEFNILGRVGHIYDKDKMIDITLKLRNVNRRKVISNISFSIPENLMDGRIVEYNDVLFQRDVLKLPTLAK